MFGLLPGDRGLDSENSYCKRVHLLFASGNQLYVCIMMSGKAAHSRGTLRKRQIALASVGGVYSSIILQLFLAISWILNGYLNTKQRREQKAVLSSDLYDM